MVLPDASASSTPRPSRGSGVAGGTVDGTPVGAGTTLPVGTGIGAVATGVGGAVAVLPVPVFRPPPAGPLPPAAV
ncbi:MAG TPA: hypothetical protein VGN71_07290 [Solirubrobacteraceae bacterium]|nr:hypothetical protein [Solirubrobacteraceae bacterium]